MLKSGVFPGVFPVVSKFTDPHKGEFIGSLGGNGVFTGSRGDEVAAVVDCFVFNLDSWSAVDGDLVVRARAFEAEFLRGACLALDRLGCLEEVDISVSVFRRVCVVESVLLNSEGEACIVAARVWGWGWDNRETGGVGRIRTIFAKLEDILLAHGDRKSLTH